MLTNGIGGQLTFVRPAILSQCDIETGAVDGPVAGSKALLPDDSNAPVFGNDPIHEKITAGNSQLDLHTSIVFEC